MPFPDRSQEDTVLWKHSPAYQLLHTTSERDKQKASSSGKPPTTWRKIWKLKAPSKIKHFCWKLYSDCLPNASNLRKRGVLSQRGCPLCRAKEEDSTHTFQRCPFTSETLTRQQLKSFPYQFACMQDLVEFSFDNLEKDQLTKWVITMWDVWRQRNLALREEPIRQPEETATFALNFMSRMANAAFVANQPFSIIENG
ncbi:hypothetical protein LIER_19721 [Lithospermum erythrorhizon]|uniref:Reverse transcriptase zinc-binding domain-containing protein n=1 Tax=Lithospermum erythrorhizon TaxID=34254 RepID=A0AAV3QLG4_LITER